MTPRSGRCSVDGLHAFFTTEEKMVAEDTDNASDVYERFANATTLISAGAINGNGNGQTAFYEDASDDGSRVLFGTFEQLVPGDTDDDVDLHQRTGGTTTLISAGTINGNGAFKQLAPGAHTVRVRATDASGNVDPTPASRSFSL